MHLPLQLEVAGSAPRVGRDDETATVFSRTVRTTIDITESEFVGTTSAATSPVSSSAADSSSDSSQSSGTDRTTVVVLSTVLSISGILVVAAVMWACIRFRRRRSGLFSRGITPIGDDEIETWKGHRVEKSVEVDVPRRSAQPPARPQSTVYHQRQESISSVRKPPSVIVYARQSEEFSPRSPPTPNYFTKMSFDGKRSLDKDLPFTPIQARAPNAREGLTDETIPGDEPYIPSPRRRASRLSKAPRTPRLAHTRNKSSRSSLSLRSPGDGYFGGYDSDHEIYPSYTRISSDVPPRLSLSSDWPAGGGLSPRPPVRAEEIGRAIG